MSEQIMAEESPENGCSTESEQQTNKNLLLVVATCTLLFTSYMYSSVNIALPAIGRDLQANVLELSWVTTAIFLTSAVLLVPFGRLADIVGLKKIYLLGMLLYAASNFISAVSSSITMLIVMRAVQGISGAMVVGNVIALISVVFPKGEKGKALGICSSAVYIGLSCSPLVSGFLTAQYGWRSIFLVAVPAGLAVVAVLLWKVKGEWRGSRGEHLDFTGILFFAAAVFLLMFGFSRLPHQIGWGCLACGIVCMAGFLFWENRIEFPLIQVALLRKNRVFLMSNLSALISYAATYSIVFFMSLYLQYVKGMEPALAGLLLAVTPATQAVLSPVTGFLSDRVEPAIIASSGMGIGCLALGSFGFLTSETSLIRIIITLAVLGVGFALFVAPNTNAVMSSVPARMSGVASAIINTMRTLGQMFSMGIAMMVLAVIMGGVAVDASNAHDFVRSVRLAYLIFAGLSLLGVFASLERGKVR